jgi:hypothetical protein
MCFGLVAKDGHANALAAASDQQKNSVLRDTCPLVGRGGAARTPTNLESIKSLPEIRATGVPSDAKGAAG